MGFFITVFIILALIEVYVFFGLRALFPDARVAAVSIQLFSFAISIAAVIMVSVVFRAGYSQATFWSNLMMGLMITFTVTKLLFGSVLLLEDVFRALKFLIQKVVSMVGSGNDVSFDSRRKFIGYAGLAIAAVPFAGLLYGTLKGKYDYKIHKVKLTFPDLPQAFDGLKIVQISDIHSGSFDSHEAVAGGVELIEQQQADLVLFTGDLVNNLAEEIEPYKDLFRAIDAPLGKFAILGNHDYGDYVQWPSMEEKAANLSRLKQQHADMGYRLLLNERVALEKDGEQIQLAGVENWGKPPFPPLGDLDKALEGIDSDAFTILMSHDPDHWEYKVRDHEKQVHLTLSGHTHGMQMGVEIPGILQWSPIKYKYPRWAGLYGEGEQYLYVNRGFGFLGYPGRAGIWPEITVIELSKA